MLKGLGGVKMHKYWVKYEKVEEARFISHLDLLRALDRSIRRAGIPIAYSQGFNPHPKLSFATPLSVGIISHGDYLEMELNSPMGCEEIKESINPKLPLGIRFLEVKEITKKVPNLGAIVAATLFKVNLVNLNELDVSQRVQELLSKDQLIIERTTKKGKRQVDIIPLIYQLKVENDFLHMLLETSSSANVKPKELLNYLQINNPNIDKIETYCRDNKNNFITPLEYLDI